MALFKEIPCVHCGGKTNLITRSKLSDEQYVCSKCTSNIPGAITSCLRDYDYEDFLSLKAYMEESKTQLEKVFKENHSFYGIHIDTEHELFYLDSIYPKTYLKFENLSECSLEFIADEAKEGVFGVKVTGKIFFKIKMNDPYFFKDEILKEGVKTTARVEKGLFKNTVKYDNPKGMDDFIHYFNDCWTRAVNAKLERLARILEEDPYTSAYEQSYQTAQTAENSELQQAMALFMIDDLSGLTLSDLKAQRNRLIKAFHPDTGSYEDTSYAQKINQAHDVLKGHIS